MVNSLTAVSRDLKPESVSYNGAKFLTYRNSETIMLAVVSCYLLDQFII